MKSRSPFLRPFPKQWNQHVPKVVYARRGVPNCWLSIKKHKLVVLTDVLVVAIPLSIHLAANTWNLTSCPCYKVTASTTCRSDRRSGSMTLPHLLLIGRHLFKVELDSHTGWCCRKNASRHVHELTFSVPRRTRLHTQGYACPGLHKVKVARAAASR